MLERKISKPVYFALAVTGLLIFLALWSAVTYTGLIRPFFLPTPTTVFTTIGRLLTEGSLLRDTGASLYRIVVGFLVSLAVALPVGLSLGLSRKFEAFTEPLVAFIRYIPPSAFIPLAIIWFGIGELEKVAIIFIGVAPYLTLLIADTVSNVRQELIEAALTLGASKWDIVTKVVIPFSLPGIWDAIRVMLGAAWTFVIIAELVGASSGLGHLMIHSQRFLKTDNIFAAIVTIGLLGMVTDYFFKISYKILFPWTERGANAER